MRSYDPHIRRMSVKNRVKTSLNLNQDEAACFVVDRFDGIVVHYAFWSPLIGERLN